VLPTASNGGQGEPRNPLPGAGHPWTIWIRLPQVSSSIAIETGPEVAGGALKATRRPGAGSPYRRNPKCATDQLRIWGCGMASRSLPNATPIRRGGRPDHAGSSHARAKVCPPGANVIAARYLACPA